MKPRQPLNIQQVPIPADVSTRGPGIWKMRDLHRVCKRLSSREVFFLAIARRPFEDDMIGRLSEKQ